MLSLIMTNNVRDNGVLKLIDFGDAIIIGDDEENGTYVGTIHCM